MWMARMTLKNYREMFWRRLAWLMPHNLVYWCVIRAWAHGTTGQYGNTEAPSLRVDECLERWELATSQPAGVGVADA